MRYYRLTIIPGILTQLKRMFFGTQAGILIAQDVVTGSRDAPHDGVVMEAIPTGRHYLIILGTFRPQPRLKSRSSTVDWQQPTVRGGGRIQ